MYELGVGHLLDMDPGEVPAAPVALTADNAATVGLQTRNLAAHRQDDMKGFGYMLRSMDHGTRQLVLDKCGTAAEVADLVNHAAITIVKGSIRSLWPAYSILMQQPANRRTQQRNITAVMTGSTKPVPRWLDGGRSPVAEVSELVNRNNLLEVGHKLSNDQLMFVILSKLPPCMRSFYEHHVRTPQAYDAFYNQLVEECEHGAAQVA